MNTYGCSLFHFSVDCSSGEGSTMYRLNHNEKTRFRFGDGMDRKSAVVQNYPPLSTIKKTCDHVDQAPKMISDIEPPLTTFHHLQPASTTLNHLPPPSSSFNHLPPLSTSFATFNQPTTFQHLPPSPPSTTLNH